MPRSSLTALREGTFLSKDLEDIAIREAFKLSSSYRDNRALIAKRYFDHPAISAKNYSTALHKSYGYEDETNELFYWLLNRADHDDLEVAKVDDEIFEEPVFEEAVEQVLKTVGSETRHELRRKKRVAAMKDALKEDVLEDLLNLVGEYVD